MMGRIVFEYKDVNLAVTLPDEKVEQAAEALMLTRRERPTKEALVKEPGPQEERPRELQKRQAGYTGPAPAMTEERKASIMAAVKEAYPGAKTMQGLVEAVRARMKAKGQPGVDFYKLKDLLKEAGLKPPASGSLRGGWKERKAEPAELVTTPGRPQGGEIHGGGGEGASTLPPVKHPPAVVTGAPKASIIGEALEVRRLAEEKVDGRRLEEEHHNGHLSPAEKEMLRRLFYEGHLLDQDVAKEMKATLGSLEGKGLVRVTRPIDSQDRPWCLTEKGIQAHAALLEEAG